MTDDNNIVIIGGGFAGVELAERLLRSDQKQNVILVDKIITTFSRHYCIRLLQVF